MNPKHPSYTKLADNDFSTPSFTFSTPTHKSKLTDRLISQEDDRNYLSHIFHILFFFTSFYTPPHNSGRVLCFHVGCPCVCPSVCPSVVRTSVCTSFPFDNLSIYKRISFKFCICIWTNKVSLELLMGTFR